MSNDEKNASAEIKPESRWNSDIRKKRRKTLRDYLGAMTSGDPSSYSNKAEIPEVSIENSMKNHFKINPEPDREFSNVTEEGEPMTPRSVPFGQQHFVPNTKATQNLTIGSQVELPEGDPNELAAEIFNDISSNSFFDQQKVEQITGDAEFKNKQTFGHEVISKTIPISEQVSSVLKNNRFFPGKESPLRTIIRTEDSFDPYTDPETNKASFNEGGYYDDKTGDAFAKLGAQANLNASGYVGDKPLEHKFSNSELQKKGLANIANAEVIGIWSEVIDQLGGIGDIKSLSDNAEDSKAFTGAQKIKSSIVNPNKTWLDKSDNIKVSYIDANGNTSSMLGVNNDNYAFDSVLSNYVDQFGDAKIFGRQHVMAISWMTAIFVQSLVSALIIDALSSAAYATLFLQPKVKNNYDSQISHSPTTPPLFKKGRRKGHPIESDLVSGDAAEILELLGVPDINELLSGPFLLELLLSFMGINQPSNSRSIVIEGKPIGIFLAYTASHTIGALQTFILALKDPWSGGFFANLGRAIAKNSREFDDELSQENANSLINGGDPNGFINFVLSLPKSKSFSWFKRMVDLGDIAIGQFMKAGREESKLTKSRQATKEVPRGYTHPQSVMNSDSLFLLPKSFLSAKALVNDDIDPTTYRIGTKKHFHTSISQEEADALEHALEADYMPFYIRDMRTNELLSFHAFLNTYSDGFSANYSGIKGFGRVEEAPIYGDTTRAISFAFTMAAFSEEDMDYMYWKLNKLVTLLYPQWSKGTKMKAPVEGTEGKKTFYMPFSQIPTASPMVRVRIGDVLTNNYSDLSAMRMMGLGDEATTSKEEDNVPLIDTESDANIVGGDGVGERQGPRIQVGYANWGSAEFIPPTVVDVGVGQQLISQIQVSQPRVGDLIKTNFSDAPEPFNIVGIANMVTPATGFSAAIINNVYELDEAINTAATSFKFKNYEIDPDAIYYAKAEFRIVGFSDGGLIWVQNTLSEAIFMGEPGAPDGFPTTQFDKKTKLTVKKFAKEKYTTQNPSLKKYSAVKIPVFAIKYDDLYKQWFPATPTKTTTMSEEEAQFLVGNPVIKSFENNRGSGMPGFITSLDIDWGLNNFLWDNKKGLRAPTLLKISCGFKPIHDIAPGIDADGFNRAPVYKIGKTSRTMHQVGKFEKTRLNAAKKGDSE